ncbi:Electron transport complex subunit RsxB [Sporomusa termitida]|uniref:Electron transport complex subunit RsxB n=1 Tax=Sporomusa termitida TaxID=2377 RepID=A0A517DWD8_9FIRM|nr:Electron transport complex subunit RsxB [Sporomusa termitida]
MAARPDQDNPKVSSMVKGEISLTAKVYFARLADGDAVQAQVQAMHRLYMAADAAAIITGNDFVAIKLHVGEGENNTRVRPELIRALVDKVKAANGNPFLTETSTLYKGERHNAVNHLLQAHRQGFGIEQVGAPFLMADGLLGNTEYEVPIPGELHKTVHVARELMGVDALFVVSHATGCISTGLGACIKNLGMGLASRKGKRRQHSAILPAIKPSLCTGCQKCRQWCPADAIIEQAGKMYIADNRCIGCGECIAVCRFDAVTYDFTADEGFLQKSMAEHAWGAVINKPGKCFYINVLLNMTKHCDCLVKQPADNLIPDLGILAAWDPVAIDKATQDLTKAAYGHTLGQLAFPERNAAIQMEHAAHIGMGSLEYELIEVF